jgi:hypothetical protein
MSSAAGVKSRWPNRSSLSASSLLREEGNLILIVYARQRAIRLENRVIQQFN